MFPQVPLDTFLWFPAALVLAASWEDTRDHASNLNYITVVGKTRSIDFFWDKDHNNHVHLSHPRYLLRTNGDESLTPIQKNLQIWYFTYPPYFENYSHICGFTHYGKNSLTPYLK